MKICIFSSEPIGEASVKGTPRAFPNGAIADGLCLSVKRHI